MERLTERLTDKSYCISDIRAIQKETFYEDMECRRGFDLYTGKAIDKLAEYEDLEEQGKLLIMAFEICVVSECTHCNYVQRRIEETWIRPELLNHDGFYETREEAEAALNEIGDCMGGGTWIS